MKINGFRIPSQDDSPPVELKVKTKTKGARLDDASGQKEAPWSQEQQRAMENALAKFSKGCTDRWDRIAEHVPGKNKVLSVEPMKLYLVCLRCRIAVHQYRKHTRMAGIPVCDGRNIYLLLYTINVVKETRPRPPEYQNYFIFAGGVHIALQAACGDSQEQEGRTGREGDRLVSQV